MRDWQNIAFIIEGWNDDAELALSGAAGGNPSYSINELKNEVLDTANATNLFKIMYAGTEIIGWVVMWAEDFGGGRELVLQVGEALGNTLKILKWIMPAFEAQARRNKCTSIRVHIGYGKNGMKRSFERAGFQEAETVMRRIV